MTDINPKRLLAACALATISAALILLLVVLPAEYGYDPLGSGEAMGLLGLSEQQNTALQVQTAPWKSDTFEFQLAPFESLEYKYRLEQGAAIIYSWQGNGAVLYEMHSEPDGAAPGFAQTFAKGRAEHRQGSYRAPFAGIHGWYWQNRSSTDIRIRLRSQGFYPYAIEFRGGHEIRREL